MSWHYQARRREHESGEVWYELVEMFHGPQGSGCTVDPVAVVGETKQELADILRLAADNVEKHPAVDEEDTQ
jgi:hypothetical protein